MEAINTHQLPHCGTLRILRYAVRQVAITGFHLLEPGWNDLLHRKLVDALDFRSPRDQSLKA